MKNWKRIMTYLMAVACVILLAACSQGGKSTEGISEIPVDNGNSTTGSGKQMKIILTVMTQQHAYFQNVIRRWESLAEENNFELTVMDPNMDSVKLEKIVEDIIASAPDGVAFSPLDSTTAVSQVQRIMDAGIKVVPYNLLPSELLGPSVKGDDYNGGVLVGENAARIWKERHPDREPVVAVLSTVGIKEVTLRVDGFIDGFRSIYPDFEPIQEGDGQGQRTLCPKLAEDMLQAHPEINIFFGVNDDSGLGALDALKEINRNTIDEALVCAIDGSEAALLEVKKPESAFKVDIGNPPKEMAEVTWDTLKKVMDGSMTETVALPVSYVYISLDEVDQWLETQYPKNK